MRKRVITSVLAIGLVLSLSVPAFAYSPSATAKIQKGSNSLIFIGNLKLDAPKNEIRHSYYTATVTKTSDNRILFTDNKSDYPPSRPYNSKYTLQHPDSGEYEILVAGTVQYYNHQSDDTPSAQDSIFYGYNSYKSKLRNDDNTNSFIKDQTKKITDTFSLDLSQYRQIKRGSTEFLKIGLIQLDSEINLAYGDTVPVYLLNKDKTNGLILKQDINGMDYLYSFIFDSGNLEITSSNKIQKEFIGDKTFFEKYPVCPIEEIK